MLAELVDHVIGVDPDRDWITVAALDSRTSAVVTTDRFPATRDGYRVGGRAHRRVRTGVGDRVHRQLRPRAHDGAATPR